MPSNSLAGLVSGVPGLYIKDYGSASSLKTVSQRGLGAEHTLVLLNGIRQNSFQNGLVDLGLLPAGELDRVEIVHGGNSAAHGSEAVAGVINVLTRTQRDPHALDVESSIGSFGYQRYRISGGLGWAHSGFRASISDERSKEDFPFVFHNGALAQNVIRTNSDFVSTYATVHGYLNLGSGGELTTFAHRYVSDRGVAGTVVSPTSKNLARQTDSDYLIQLICKEEMSDNVALQFAAQSRHAYERYIDPDLRIGMDSALDTYFKNFDNRFSSSATVKTSASSKINTGFEIARTSASGTSLSTRVTRWHAGPFVAFQQAFVPENGPCAEVSLYPSVRLDAFTQAQPSWSPQVAVVLVFRKIGFGAETEATPTLRFSISRNFRVLTFNEMYYAGGGGRGNPDLKPERSFGFDAGGGLSLKCLGYHSVQLTYFGNTMNDRIVWTPAGNVGVVPKNLRVVESSGVEASWSWDILNGPLSLDVSYTHLRSLKTSKDNPDDPNVDTQLVQVPTEMANASLSWSIQFKDGLLRSVDGILAHRFVGLRYTNEDNSGFLPPYNVVSLGAVAHWETTPLKFATKMEVQNVFDEAYQTVLGYPMPLRSFRLTLVLSY